MLQNFYNIQHSQGHGNQKMLYKELISAAGPQKREKSLAEKQADSLKQDCNY